jgi:hypothetical protein
MAGGLIAGCTFIPQSLQGDVYRVLKASEQDLPKELSALNSKLSASGAAAEDVLHFESAVNTFRRVERLELATISGIDATGQALIDGLDSRAWQRILDYGNARMGFYGRSPAVATGTLKGILAEEVFDVSPEFAQISARAQARGARLGIAPADIKYVRGTRGITISEKQLKFVNHGELTDGLVKGVRKVDLSDADKAERLAERGRYAQWAQTRRGALSDVEEDLYVLMLKESKSPSNMLQIAQDHGDNWLGQMGNNLERMHELPVYIDGKWYTPLQVRLSIYRTEWVAVVPKGQRLPTSALERLSVRTAERPVGRLFRQYEMGIADDIMNEMAKRMFDRRMGRLP